MLRSLRWILVISLLGAPAQAEPCLARALMAEIGAHYTRLHGASVLTSRAAASDLERLMPGDDYHRFFLQLRAEGYPVESYRLFQALTQIQADVTDVQDGLPLDAPLAAVRAVFPVTSEALDCTPSLKTLPSMAGQKDSLGDAGNAVQAASFQQPKQYNNPSGALSSFSLNISAQKSGSAAFAAVLFLVGLAILFRKHVIHFFGQRHRSSRRSLNFDFNLTSMNRETAELLTVSSVDISRGGMKIALNSSSANPPKVGGAVTLHLPSSDVGATIVWSNQFYCGIAFQRALSNHAFRRLTDEMSRQA